MRQEVGGEGQTKLGQVSREAGHLAVDSGGVYWAEDDGVHRMEVEGGGAELLYATPDVITELHVDATHVYIEREEASLWRVPKTGGDEEAVVEASKDDDPLGGFAVDRTHVYWVTLLSGELRRKPKSGGPTEVLYEAALEANLTARGQSVLVAENRFQSEQRFVVMEVSKSGGKPTIAAEVAHPIQGLDATSDRVAVISTPCQHTPCESGLHASILVFEAGARIKEVVPSPSIRTVVAVGDEFWWTPNGRV